MGMPVITAKLIRQYSIQEWKSSCMVIWHPIMNDQTLSFARDQWEAKSCFLKKETYLLMSTWPYYNAMEHTKALLLFSY